MISIKRSYSCRRYLHIEAVFVFDDRLDHWSAPSSGAGHFGLPTFEKDNSVPNFIYRVVSTCGARGYGRNQDFHRSSEHLGIDG
jgi:hypothetical protein